MNRSLLLFFVFFCMIFSSEKIIAQSCANYTPTRTTGITYNSINATGNAFPGWRNTSLDDNRTLSQSIGFDFWYLGVRYTSLSASTNGFIDFSNSAADGTGGGAYGYKNTKFSNNTLLAVTPFYEDMTTNQALTDPLGTDIKYLLAGTAPNRTFTIQWYEMSRFSEATPSSLNFQIVLHESTGTIDFIYGTMTYGTATWTYTCGINNSTMGGPTAAELKCQQTENTTTFNNTAKNNLSTAPTSNSQIVFTTPVPTAAPTSLSFTGVTKTAMTLNWTDNASNEVGYVLYNSTDGVNYTFVTQLAANSNTYTASVFASTTYYWKVYAVTDGCLSAALSGTQATLPALEIISTGSTNWNSTGTWDCTCIPTAGDNVTIRNGDVVTLDVNGNCNKLTVGQGTSGQLTIGSSGTARTLTLNNNLVISAGATVTTGATAATHVLNIYGDITNAGTLNFAPSGTRVCNVTFLKNGNQNISGAGGTTNFNLMTLNMGTSQSNILNVSSTNFTATSNFLTLTNGTFKMSSAATVTPYTGSATIPNTAGLWVNNASASVSTTGGTISFAGLVRATAGTLNIGNAADNNLTSNGGTLTIDGGTVNVAGRVDRPSASVYLTFFNMSAGTLTVNTTGSTLASYAPFHIDQAGSTFIMSGGTIVIRRAGSGNYGFLNNGSTATVTGGTLQIGDGSTPAAQTMLINTNRSIYNLTTSSANATAQLSTSDLTVLNNVTLTTGTLNLNSLNINVGGNWVNNATFTHSSRVVQFNGTALQTISGSTTTAFYGLTINNSAGVTLSTPATVAAAGTLTLTSGKLNTDATNILELLDETSVAPVGTATSYINGPMRYNMSTNSGTASTLNFPIGDASNWRPCVLSLKHSANTNYKYIATMSSSSARALGWTLPAGTIDTVSAVRYWDIVRTDNANANAGTVTDLVVNAGTPTPTVKLYFGTNDDVWDGSNLSIVKNVGGASAWVDIGGTGAPVATGSQLTGSITSTSSPTSFASFSRFTLGSKLSGKNGLPVELTSFEAKPNSSSVNLLWTTATEINNNFFTVERSVDGEIFSEIATLNSKAINGNSNSTLNYETVDNSPLSGVSYYRLKQTDFNGQFKNSQIVSVDLTAQKNMKFIVYPNPNQGQFTVDFSGMENSHEMEIVMHDQQGKVAYSNKINSDVLATGTFKIVPDHQITAGVYIVNFIVEGVKYPVRVVVN